MHKHKNSAEGVIADIGVIFVDFEFFFECISIIFKSVRGAKRKKKFGKKPSELKQHWLEKENY